MPAHIKKRADRGGVYYLVDGRVIQSLGTTVKRFAEHRLDLYIKGKFGFGKGITVMDYYSQWIERKREPMIRRSAIRDYRQHFGAYILPEIGKLALTAVDVRTLEKLRDHLLGRGLSAKTVRNILGASLRRMWRDARKDQMVERNPFEALDMPARDRTKPDPFTADERDALLHYVLKAEAFYYPFIRFQFETGCRPGETAALIWADISQAHRTIAINKSRHMGKIDKPKTSGSWRVIEVSKDLIDLITAARLPWHGDKDPVFYNKVHGAALNPNEWASTYWKRLCLGAQIPHKKFYATRHTSITEAVKRGENLLAIARYHGTSVEMIERNYCGPLQLNQTKIEPDSANSLKSVMVPTGLEPGQQSIEKIKQLINQAVMETQKRRKVG